MGILTVVSVILFISAVVFARFAKEENTRTLVFAIVLFCFAAVLVVFGLKYEQDIKQELLRDNKLKYVSDKFGETTLVLKDSTMQNTAKFLGIK